MSFKLTAPFEPQGDQPKAIEKIEKGFKKLKRQTLLGVTGSGKTFSMGHTIQRLQRPTIILCHNKTLAAQIYNEMKLLFPDNAVEYFVSYFDYYQPESYMPATDTYIEKETQVNDKLERLRLSAMHSLSTRKDVIIVASVSCIYGIGDPAEFRSLVVEAEEGQQISRQDFLHQLVAIQYERNDLDLAPGRFRVRGDSVDLIPGYANTILRFSFFGDELESINELDAIHLSKLANHKRIRVFPARQFVVSDPKVERALATIAEELDLQLPQLDMLEAHRLEQRTKYDLEMIKEMGYCNGIENYSRHFDGRLPGTPPYTLLDYMGDDWLMIIDENHVTIPQLHGMFKGYRSRKQSLVEHGFRLPSAYDNRPLTFDEFDAKLNKVLYVSATPAEYEMSVSGQIVEQIIRPTGLVDPIVDVHPAEGQIEDLLKEIKDVVNKGFRVLVTTLTKRMAEHLTDFLAQRGVAARYLHAEIETLERTEIIRQLRAREFDVLVGINLLREGLDIPEVALVAILDADKEGFLRNTRSLIQTIGRAARNVEGHVILYAERMTPSMDAAIKETARRRQLQLDFNKKHGIIPRTIIKAVEEKKIELKDTKHIPKSAVKGMILDLEQEMNKASEQLEFEKAIELRDKIKTLQKRLSPEEAADVYD